ncbi:MAG: hypothetical protein HC865_10310 [Cyanobacteria bacterium RU_5_0]|nr:hypothetical protein [Cyanobacteria bacterium RU_5_0]
MPDIPTSNLSSPDPTASEQDIAAFMNDWLNRLKSESTRNQLQLVQQIAQLGDVGLEALMSFLLERQSSPTGLIDGKVYQILLVANTSETKDFLHRHFPQGVVLLRSERNIDYALLQTLLVQQDFEAADRLTLEKLCELVGTPALQRKWLYFSEVEQFPAIDLQTINTLWLVYSEGRFGYSVQREIWLSLGRDWDKLWTQIGWKSGNNWTRYPQEFTWDLSAPKGHLPLSNQLRGVRVINSLLSHSAWN